MNMKTNAKTGQTAEQRVLRRGITLALFLSLTFCGIPEAAAQKVRVAMPAKSMTFLNFYVGDKFGVYKAEGLDVSLEVIKTDSDVANSLAALQSGAADVAMLSIPFNFKAEELGFRNLGSAVNYLQTPFAGVGAADAKIKTNPSQVKRMIRTTLKGIDFTRDPANQEKVIGLLIDEFKLDRKTAALSLKEIIKAFTRDGSTPEDAVKAEIKEIREQAKIKNEIPVSQVLDYKLLEEVLAEGKR